MKLVRIGFVWLPLLGLLCGYLLMRSPSSNVWDDRLEAQPQAPRQTLPVTRSWIPVDPTPLEFDPIGSVAEPHRNMVRSVDTLPQNATEKVPERCQQWVSVVGLTAKSCDVYVAVFETESGFPKPELSTQTIVVPATEEQVQFSLELPTNRPMTIAVFQDIDGNGKLTKGQMGIPREPYGFSNNARGMFGPPAFTQAAFVLGSERENSKPIEIKVH
jgi:uncharacterized protein (DUF2141 family)